MQIYINSGHEDTAGLANCANWPQMRTKMSGMFIGPPTYRELTSPIRDRITACCGNRSTLSALPWQAFNRNRGNLVLAERAGLQVHTVFVYDENSDPRSFGSTLSPSMIQEVRRELPDYKVVTNCRVWDPFGIVLEGVELHKLIEDHLDGIVFEFIVTTDQCVLDNWSRGIRFALSRGRDVYLLTPPNHDMHRFNYVEEYEDMCGYLKKKLARMWDYPTFRLVPANYGFGQTHVPTVPETGNTALAAALAAFGV